MTVTSTDTSTDTADSLKLCSIIASLLLELYAGGLGTAQKMLLKVFASTPERLTTKESELIAIACKAIQSKGEELACPPTKCTCIHLIAHIIAHNYTDEINDIERTLLDYITVYGYNKSPNEFLDLVLEILECQKAETTQPKTAVEVAEESSTATPEPTIDPETVEAVQETAPDHAQETDPEDEADEAKPVVEDEADEDEYDFIQALAYTATQQDITQATPAITKEEEATAETDAASNLLEALQKLTAKEHLAEGCDAEQIALLHNSCRTWLTTEESYALQDLQQHPNVADFTTLKYQISSRLIRENFEDLKSKQNQLHISFDQFGFFPPRVKAETKAAALVLLKHSKYLSSKDNDYLKLLLIIKDNGCKTNEINTLWQALRAKQNTEATKQEDHEALSENAVLPLAIDTSLCTVLRTLTSVQQYDLEDKSNRGQIALLLKSGAKWLNADEAKELNYLSQDSDFDLEGFIMLKYSISARLIRKNYSEYQKCCAQLKIYADPYGVFQPRNIVETKAAAKIIIDNSAIKVHSTEYNELLKIQNDGCEPEHFKELYTKLQIEQQLTLTQSQKRIMQAAKHTPIPTQIVRSASVTAQRTEQGVKDNNSNTFDQRILEYLDDGYPEPNANNRGRDAALWIQQKFPSQLNPTQTRTLQTIAHQGTNDFEILNALKYEVKAAFIRNHYSSLQNVFPTTIEHFDKYGYCEPSKPYAIRAAARWILKYYGDYVEANDKALLQHVIANKDFNDSARINNVWKNVVDNKKVDYIQQ